jgi:tRNA pseudouridine55 synthase
MNTYILPFWKKIGTSSSIIAKRVSLKLNLPTSHTGTLDPLAEGVVKVIVGDDSKFKEKFISEDKIYRFKFLFGISTDTHDALGIIDNFSDSSLIPNLDVVKESLNLFIGKYHQQYPNYSSKKVKGKSLWEYQRLNLHVPETFIDGEIKKIDYFTYEKISKKELLEKFFRQINLIHGNFRQEEILKNYEDLNLPEYFYQLEVEVTMTRGLYVRGLARDLGKKLNIPCIIVDLVRVSDGDIQKEDCVVTEDYFREEILSNQNFLYPEFKNL